MRPGRGGLNLGQDFHPTAVGSDVMNGTSLSGLALILSTGCAAAQMPADWGRTRILPPIEYEHEYPGALTISRMATEEEMRVACRHTFFKYNRLMGCNRRWGMVRCEIYIVANEILAQVGLDYETTLRHEIGHCNGWGDGWPDPHEGARYKDGLPWKPAKAPFQVVPLRPQDFPAKFLFPTR